jgi:hypothetical protein
MPCVGFARSGVDGPSSLAGQEGSENSCHCSQRTEFAHVAFTVLSTGESDRIGDPVCSNAWRALHTVAQGKIKLDWTCARSFLGCSGLDRLTVTHRFTHHLGCDVVTRSGSS